MRTIAVLALAAALGGCGYHVGVQPSVLPASVHTIAVPAFANASTSHRLPVLLTADVTRELIARTHYRIVHDPSEADATLAGSVVAVSSYPTVFDPQTNRAAGVQMVVTLQLALRDRAGRALFSRPTAEYRERYEISSDPQQYFDESGTAMQRLSRDVARSVVTAILEAF